MKRIEKILLIILFLLQGTNQYSVLVIVLLILLFVINLINNNNKKIKLPIYFQFAFIIYSGLLLLGIINSHANLQVDVKFQIFNFIFYLFLLNKSKLDFISLLFNINILVFVIYSLLYFGILPNIWSENTFGYMGRVYGPVIIAYPLLSFIYLFYNKSFDKKLGLSFILAVSYILLTTNFMNLIIIIGLTFLNVIDVRKVFKPKYIVIIVSLIAILVSYVQSPYANELIKRKASYIFAPWEYGSIETRIQDFNQAISKAGFSLKEKIIGVGYGASTEINRGINYTGVDEILNFQEIDNGFYYLYHRGGWSLILIFFMTHIWLFLKLPDLNSKFGFILIVFVTNILSIHYFNYYFYLLIPFLIITEGKKVNVFINNKKLKYA